MTDRREIEAALKRRLDEARGPEGLKAWNEQQSDWWGVCRKCGAHLTGTPKQLRGHVCGS